MGFVWLLGFDPRQLKLVPAINHLENSEVLPIVVMTCSFNNSQLRCYWVKLLARVAFDCKEDWVIFVKYSLSFEKRFFDNPGLLGITLKSLGLNIGLSLQLRRKSSKKNH